jgi:hypothetical protein
MTAPAPLPQPDLPAAEILRRMARGEGYEDIIVALKKRHATYQKDYIRRFVLRLPMRGRMR